MAVLRVLVFSLSLAVFSLIATQVLAYQAGYAPALGTPVVRLPVFTILYPVYRPWQGYQWAWWWGQRAPQPCLYAALSGLLGGLVVWGLCRPTPPKADEAHWATRRELRRAELLGKTGVVVGKVGGRILRYHGKGHLLTIAGTQTGKTVSLVKPTLLEYPGSLFVNDPKMDLYPATQRYRHTLGHVWHLTPLSATTTCYNPLAAIRVGTTDELRDCQLIAQYLTNPSGQEVQDDTARHFQELAETFFVSLLLYGGQHPKGTTLGGLQDIVTQTPWEALCKDLLINRHPEVQRAGSIFMAIAEKELSGIRTTVTRALSLWSDPRVRHMTSRSDYSLTLLREAAQPCTIYYGVPFQDQGRLLPLTRLITSQIFDYATARLTGWTHPLLMLLEELPSLERLPWLEDGLNHAAQYGVQLCLLSPSYEALVRPSMYGVHNNLLDGCRVQVYFGLYDAHLAENVSKRIGMETTVYKRKTTMQGRVSRTTEERQEPLASATALLQIPEEEVVIIAGQYKVQAQQARFYKRRQWRKRHDG